jgi:hypothetical protein
MLDLIISGGDVVTPQGVVQGDVAIAGETIAAIAAADVLSAETAKRVINATGHIVIPGGIDPHVHLHHVWFKPDGTPLVTAGPEQVGRAALHGGTTTFIDSIPQVFSRRSGKPCQNKPRPSATSDGPSCVEEGRDVGVADAHQPTKAMGPKLAGCDEALDGSLRRLQDLRGLRDAVELADGATRRG